jgi:hypothetical protein
MRRALADASVTEGAGGWFEQRSGRLTALVDDTTVFQDPPPSEGGTSLGGGWFGEDAQSRPSTFRSVMYLTITGAVRCGMSLSGPILASCTAARK